MARTLVINEQIKIPGKEILLSFARSAGPGGQNVNKVNSKAMLRWNVVASTSLPAAAHARFLKRFATRINQAGELILSSDRYRDQPRNVADCYEKLRQLIVTALTVPRTRKKTRPSRSSVERRLEAKRTGAAKKQRRSFRPDNEN
jgi:ribosome-associated protein